MSNGSTGGAHIDAAMNQIIEKIERYGWAVIGVGGGGGDNPFSYTVGMAATHGVELVVVGLGMEQGHSVLAAARDALADATVTLTGHQVVSARVIQPRRSGVLDARGEEVVVPMPVRFDLLERDEAPVNIAHQLDAGDWALWQIIWPDVEGRLPDHPDYPIESLRDQVVPAR